jgi:hypothetical protein
MPHESDGWRAHLHPDGTCAACPHGTHHRRRLSPARPLPLGIAATKALLIAVVFMHLRHGTATSGLAAVAGLLWLSILLAGTLDDVITRGWLPVPGK